jgi:hypothetical protein
MSWRRGKAYVQDLWGRVLAAPGRLQEVAERFGVRQAYVLRVRSSHERLGQTSAKAQLGGFESAAHIWSFHQMRIGSDTCGWIGTSVFAYARRISL